MVANTLNIYSPSFIWILFTFKHGPVSRSSISVKFWKSIIERVVFWEYSIITEGALLEKADDLLFRVLWAPFRMPRDIRGRFEKGDGELVFAALDGDEMAGVFVLVLFGEVNAELRHAAVSEKYSGKGIGRSLWRRVLDHIGERGINRVEVYARNTAIGFWEKIGFTAESGWLDHELFIGHGIRFKKMAWRRGV